MSIKDKVAIVGMGCSKFGERWDCGLSDLIIESAYEAFEDAHIGPEDIQAVFYSQGNQPNGGTGATPIADTLKMSGIPMMRNENFCASGHVALIQAAMAIASGEYDVVMAIGAEKLKDTGFGGLGVGRGWNPAYEARRTGPGSFAMIASRYFAKYGLSMEEGKRLIAKIAVKNHHNGMLSPRAHFHKELTVEDVLKAPIIAYPLGLFDCCGNSDGSACAILTRADIAEKYTDKPIYIKGYGMAVDSTLSQSRPHFEWTGFDALKSSSRQAYAMAGITNPREQLDLAEVHDCFTCTEMIIYEDFGFSAPGHAADDIESGFFELHGGLPVNVDGGLKCFGHPVGASGIRMTYEIFKQLQGRVDNPLRQVPGCKLGLSHTFGGSPQVSAVMIAGNERG